MLLHTDLCYRLWDPLIPIKHLSFILGQVKFANLYFWKVSGKARWRLSRVITMERERSHREVWVTGLGRCEGTGWAEEDFPISREHGGSIYIYQDWMEEKEKKVCVGGGCGVGNRFNFGCDELKCLWEIQEVKPERELYMHLWRLGCGEEFTGVLTGEGGESGQKPGEQWMGRGKRQWGFLPWMWSRLWWKEEEIGQWPDSRTKQGELMWLFSC